MRKQVQCKNRALPTSPYSQGIVVEGAMVYVSGQGPRAPDGTFNVGSFRAQAEQTFRNIGAILQAAGSSWEHAVKVNVYLASVNDFEEMNEVYRQFAKEPYPARTTVQAGFARNDMLIEVDCVAVVPE